MKYEIKNNLIVAIAENIEESVTLLKLSKKPVVNNIKRTRPYKKRAYSNIRFKTDPAMLAIGDMDLDTVLKITTNSWKSKNQVSNTCWIIGHKLGKKFTTKKVYGGWEVTRIK